MKGGLIIEPEDNVVVVTEELKDILIDTCNGKQTKAEKLGFNETAIMRACNFV